VVLDDLAVVVRRRLERILGNLLDNAREHGEETAVEVGLDVEGDTLLLTVPSQLGVEYNAAMLETIASDIAPALGWAPTLVG